MRAVPLIEPLEDRIAPAAVVTIAPNHKSASYTDTAGDTVIVTTTKGAFTSGMFIFDPSTAGQLTELSITGHKDFTGANIHFTILPVAGGTDAVNIGFINATGLNLGSVTLPGDLGYIDVGGGKGSMMALGKLNVQSMGVYGSDTQGGLPNPTTVSTIIGSVGSITVANNVDGAISVQDYSSARPGSGNINKLMIGGSLDGNTVTNGLGEIAFTGKLGTAFIGGGIEGGSQNFSGSISGDLGTFSKIGSITVAGSVPDDPNPNPIPTLPGTSILGGAGGLSGGISAASVGTVLIAGDVYGGTGTASGEIQGGIVLQKVTIDGSLIGGNFTQGNPGEANSSGLVFGGSIGSVAIGKGIYGGSGLDSGEVLSLGLIKSVVVIGNVEGGTAGTSSSTGLSGVIHGNSLGKVLIDGSLTGGNANTDDPSQNASGGGSILSNTTIGSVFVSGSITGGSGANSGQISTDGGKVGSIVTGSVIGGSGASSGQISVDGALGELVITGGLTGGSGASSGLVNVNGALGNLIMTGSVIGGSAASTGQISVDGALGKLTMTGSLTGGSATDSGIIQVNGAVNSLQIGGSVTGGTADNTGTISTFGLLKNTIIGGDIMGSSSGTTMLTNTGYIQAAGIGTMRITGSLIAGSAGSGGLDTSGAIRSSAAIGSLTLGNLTGQSTNPAIISAPGRGALTGNYTSDVAIGKITILGAAQYGDILAGYGTDTNNGAQPLGTGVNADAQIGTVTIDGALTATNIIAGAGPGSGGFGTASSAALTGAGVSDLPTIISKISKIVLNGTLNAPSDPSATYGIAAQYVVSAIVDGQKVPLIPGPDNDTFAAGKEQNLGSSSNIFVYEV
ncbi:MAG TPA: hypothetical protein VHY22_00025 [Chthoniobacteraceae bacterium]|nr:hypothetical protein [Chthoniobacteraceae bacterium]